MLAVVILLVLMYLAGLFLAAWISIHPPRIPLFSSPGAFGVPQESFTFVSEEAIECVAWWMPAAEPKAVAVLAHGYAMNRSELAPIAVQLWQAGVSCLLFDFRAHGRSRGGMSTIGWRERLDVQAAVTAAKDKCPGVPVVLIGSSMGSAACAFALAEEWSLADGLVLDSSYSKLGNAVPGWWRFLGGVPLQVLLWPVLPIAAAMARLNVRRVDVAEALRRVNCPVLVLHGEKDDLAPPSEAERNLASLPAGTKVVWFQGCGHTEGRWVYPDVYWQAVKEFVFSINKSTIPLREESKKE